MNNFINCPKCNAKLCTSISISEKDEDKRPPNEGDYNLCVHCQTLSVFEMDDTNNLTLRLSTEEEKADFLTTFINKK